jgi:hypothetical protein
LRFAARATRRRCCGLAHAVLGFFFVHNPHGKVRDLVGAHAARADTVLPFELLNSAF